jgi:hypothetical protein
MMTILGSIISTDVKLLRFKISCLNMFKNFYLINYFVANNSVMYRDVVLET